MNRGLEMHKSFPFFRNQWVPNERDAVSLVDYMKMQIADIRSANFDFKCQDFERQIMHLIGGAKLTIRIGRIRKESHGDGLRSEIIQVVKGRLEGH